MLRERTPVILLCVREIEFYLHFGLPNSGRMVDVGWNFDEEFPRFDRVVDWIFKFCPHSKETYYAWRAPEGLFFSSIIWNRRTSTRTVLLIDWRGRCVLSLIFKLYTLETRLPILYSHCEADVIRKPKWIWRLANKRKSTNLERFSRIRLNSRTQLSVASNETAFLLVSFFAFFSFSHPFPISVFLIV